MPDDVDDARRQAQREHSQSQNWTNTHNWDRGVREAYEAERTRLQRESEKK